MEEHHTDGRDAAHGIQGDEATTGRVRKVTTARSREGGMPSHHMSSQALRTAWLTILCC
jgi:hypothetical protein